MAEPADGVEALRARVERRSRAVPPPRRPRQPDRVGDVDEGTEGASPPRKFRAERVDGGGGGAPSRPMTVNPPAADTADSGPAPSVSIQTTPPRSESHGEAQAQLPRKRNGGATAPASQGPTEPDRDESVDRTSSSSDPPGAWSVPEREASSPGAADEPTANLTLRVRQSLDFRLAELIHELRREGVRSTKKELIEMCLSEMPATPTEELRDRLRSYRDRLPRDL